MALSLLELPTEVRNLIWSHVLSSDKPVDPVTHHQEGHPWSLIQVCRQTYYTSASWVYQNNTLLFHELDGLRIFRGNLREQRLRSGEDSASNIISVVLDFRHDLPSNDRSMDTMVDDLFATRRQLRRFENLAHIEVWTQHDDVRLRAFKILATLPSIQTCKLRDLKPERRFVREPGSARVSGYLSDLPTHLRALRTQIAEAGALKIKDCNDEIASILQARRSQRPRAQ